jgi:hypothetical protein
MEWLRHHVMLIVLLCISPALLTVAALLMRIEHALIAQVRYNLEEKKRNG